MAASRLLSNFSPSMTVLTFRYFEGVAGTLARPRPRFFKSEGLTFSNPRVANYATFRLRQRARAPILPIATRSLRVSALALAWPPDRANSVTIILRIWATDFFIGGKHIYLLAMSQCLTLTVRRLTVGTPGRVAGNTASHPSFTAAHTRREAPALLPPCCSCMRGALRPGFDLMITFQTILKS